jgi:hypothetical protein
MNPFDDQQIEELSNFDYIADEDFINTLIDEEFNLNDYLNSNMTQ